MLFAEVRMSRGHFIGLNHHRLMLSDQRRMDAYHRAIVAGVKPGDVVVDLGTGTGILAFWAARVPGTRVYAIEPHEIIEVARRVAEANQIDNVIFVRGDSREITLPEPADCLITECMGNFFVTDEMQPVLRDARRHLKATGCVLPQAISLKLAPVWLPMWNELRFWEAPVGGIDYSSAKTMALNASYVLEVEPELLLGPTATWQAFDLLAAPDCLSGAVELVVTRPAKLHGVLGWFDADLGNGIELSTGPGQRTHWGQMLFPIAETAVVADDRLTFELSLRMDPDYRWIFEWRGAVVSQLTGPREFEHSSRYRFTGRPDNPPPPVAQSPLRSGPSDD